jgi:hypothetical protein
VESLIGIIDLPADFNYKKEYCDYLQEKYKWNINNILGKHTQLTLGLRG